MQFDPNKVTFFARTDARGQNVPFGIKAKDRQRHVYVIGKTGMGKSTLLENMAVQDLQNGEGMAFIDPHGSAAETLLSYVPQDRVNDVLYFSPSDMGYPISFNIMEDVGPDKRHLVVSGLMSVFKKIWVDAWSARMEYILQNTLLALLEYPDSTLLGVNRMLSDKDYRKKVVDNVKDPSVKAFWVDEFAKYNERYMQEAGDAIKNKIGQFTANPVIRNIVGQPKSSFDIRKMMDERKIIIMNLSKGLIGETNANLLGSMLTTRIYLAAMSRADLPLEKMRTMPNFYFYVDEFQSFANATFANILSEARKYHLNLTIAHQYIEQMEEDVRNAVFGNVGTIISFRVGPFDAEVLETIFTPQFLAADLVNLGFAQVYLTLMIDGIGSQPFSATTLPPITPPTMSCKDMVIAASRRQYGHLREEVEVLIQKFHEPIVPPKPARKEGDMEHNKEELRRGHAERHPQEKQPENTIERKFEKGPRIENGKNNVEDVRQPRERTERSLRSEAKRQEQNSDKRTKEQQHKPRKENVDDLRSVLKRIVQTDAEKNGISVDTKEGGSASRTELKSALASALGKETATAVPDRTTPSVVVESKPFLKEEARPVVETTPMPPPIVEEVVTQDEPPPPPQEASAVIKQETEKTHRPPVTPKELERMMRVTTSDKPPF